MPIFSNGCRGDFCSKNVQNIAKRCGSNKHEFVEYGVKGIGICGECVMDKIYQKFLRKNISLAPMGVECREDNTPYFCTPKGASIFGWTGVDGIHFCFIRGFGGMVFSVSPMNGAPNYVHLLAKDFLDFLRLILACGSAAAVEQGWMWDETQFETFLRENPLTQAQRQAMEEISEKMKLTPMEQPWAYLKALQSAFDYSRIRYTEDYDDVTRNPTAEQAPPEWKVYFEGNFWGHHGKDRAGKEIRLDAQFDWAGYHWVVPAAYSCGKGLVVDFCMQVEAEAIRSFMEKWKLNWESASCGNITREQQMQMEWDSPLCFPFDSRLELNGKTLQTSHGCSVGFNPCLPAGIICELEAKWTVDQYGLNPSYGWVIYRNAFPWKGKRPPEIKSLSLTMEQQPGQVPGPRFKVHGPGDSLTFSHPASGETYTLTVQEMERQTIPQGSFGSARWLYPTHYTAMSYTFSPEPAENITLLDCDEGDRPVEIAPEEGLFRPDATAACSVGIIGGADGPTAIVFGESSPGKLHTVCSALHFEPVQDDIEWRVVFHVKQFEEASFSLI